MLERILIANRGVVASRIIETAKRLGVETVIAYSLADKDTLPVKMADFKCCIGEGPVAGSYLDMEGILQAAINTDSVAIHPGYGFLSENSRFADMVTRAGLIFIGPSGKTINLMGDKLEAKILMQNAGLKVIPGPLEPIPNYETAKTHADKIGYPVILKARYGGGGLGMEICTSSDDLSVKFAKAQTLAQRNFGNGELILENYFAGGFNHIEAQIIGDDKSHGNVLYLLERECSVQRNHQKMVEEATSTSLNYRMREKLGKSLVQLCKTIGYSNAGTVEFIYSNGELYAMEMNTRLQVEHRVTEKITGLDLVELQLISSAGIEFGIKQENISRNGHSIQCRINAEDPYNNFERQSGGTITEHKYPTGSDIIYDTYIPEIKSRQDGFVVPPFYDSMIGIVVAHGSTRTTAISKMKRALGGLKISGIHTNIPFHLQLLERPEFANGTYDTDLVKNVLTKRA